MRYNLKPQFGSLALLPQKKTPFTRHQVKAWSEAKGESFLEGKGISLRSKIVRKGLRFLHSH